MLQEAFKFLFDAGLNSAPGVVKATAEPEHVYFLRGKDGTLTRTEAKSAPEKHTALSLQAIVELATRNDERGQVWYSTGAVTLCFGASLRDRTTLSLHLSEPIKQLVSWRDQKPSLAQADLIRTLRTTFRDAMAQAGTLLESLKKVRFNQQSQINAEVGHGKASLGKEIMGEVTGVGAIPEYVTFNMPVFANPCFRSLRASVECALDPDAATGTFRVIPLPGQIEAAIDAGNAGVGAQLAESLPRDFPVFYGTP